MPKILEQLHALWVFVLARLRAHLRGNHDLSTCIIMSKNSNSNSKSRKVKVYLFAFWRINWIIFDKKFTYFGCELRCYSHIFSVENILGHELLFFIKIWQSCTNTMKKSFPNIVTFKCKQVCTIHQIIHVYSLFWWKIHLQDDKQFSWCHLHTTNKTGN